MEGTGIAEADLATVQVQRCDLVRAAHDPVSLGADVQHLNIMQIAPQFCGVDQTYARLTERVDLDIARHFRLIEREVQVAGVAYLYIARQFGMADLDSCRATFGYFQQVAIAAVQGRAIGHLDLRLRAAHFNGRTVFADHPGAIQTDQPAHALLGGIFVGHQYTGGPALNQAVTRLQLSVE
ncbi:hypothetical protein D3C78_1347220 [compost metagenome]